MDTLAYQDGGLGLIPSDLPWWLGLFYVSFILVPVLALISIGGLARCAVVRRRPGGFLIAAMAATVTIPLFWLIVGQFARLENHADLVVVPLILIITVALVGLGVLTRRPDSPTHTTSLTHTTKRHIRELMASADPSTDRSRPNP